jgi:hypothetical protein
VIAEIHAEMRGVRVELGRLRTLDSAILAERDPTMWLNAGSIHLDPDNGDAKGLEPISLIVKLTLRLRVGRVEGP